LTVNKENKSETQIGMGAGY